MFMRLSRLLPVKVLATQAVVPADDLCPLGNHGSGELGEGVDPVMAVFCRDFFDVMRDVGLLQTAASRPGGAMAPIMGEPGGEGTRSQQTWREITRNPSERGGSTS